MVAAGAGAAPPSTRLRAHPIEEQQYESAGESLRNLDRDRADGGRDRRATTVVHSTDGALTQANGKMTGAGSGQGVFPVAVGDAAPLAGKSFVHSVETTGYNGLRLT